MIFLRNRMSCIYTAMSRDQKIASEDNNPSGAIIFIIIQKLPKLFRWALILAFVEKSIY